MVGAADPGPREHVQLLSPQTTTNVSVGWIVFSPRPGWRPAQPDETPGQLEPEAYRTTAHVGQPLAAIEGDDDAPT